MRVVFLALFFALPAFADEPRAIDFSQAITGLEGKPLIMCDDPDPGKCSPEMKGKPYTLGFVSASALVGQFPDERDLAGAEKVKREMLAERVVNGGKVALTTDDITLIKNEVSKAYGPLIVGKAWRMLDPASAARP